MLNKKELIAILVIGLILAFTISLIRSFEIFLYTLMVVFLVILINVFAKKVSAFYFDSDIEVKIWEVERYGFKPAWKFKRPFPAGAFFPIIFTALSLGYVNWMASLVFDVKSKIYRAAKRHGVYKFSEIPEFHLGLIAASGIAANLLFAVIGYLINFPEFTRLNIYYAFFNMIPLSSLDGNKIFFGNLVLWSFLASITFIGVLLAIFVI